MQVPKRRSENKRTAAIDYQITQEKYKELEKELEKLEKVSRPQASAEVQRLAQEGDFSENVPYQMAKRKLRGINSAIIRIQDQLKNAQIIKRDSDVSRVQVGHKVTVEINGKRQTFQILGSTQTEPLKGIVSRHSPIGQALLGSKKGEQVEVRLANGNEVKYKILKIE